MSKAEELDLTSICKSIMEFRDAVERFYENPEPGHAKLRDALRHLQEDARDLEEELNS